jgi:hypothetical protein
VKPKTLQELYSTPTCWTQTHSAINADGYDVGPNDNDACCWCLLGGVAHVYEETIPIRRKLAESALQLFSTRIDRASPNTAVDSVCCQIVVDFNDNKATTIDDIRKVVAHANV